MTLVSALAAGAVVGVRHALEPDHLAAVATLVRDDDRNPARIGASWGVGHSVPVVALGLLFVALGVRLPESVTTLFEAVVGVVLVYLGARMLWSLRGDGTRVGVEAHDHGDDGVHSHLHLGPLSLPLGRRSRHGHLDSDSALVGALHGFAGSGALVVLLVSSAPTVGAAASFLAAFALLSVATMAAVSALWGRTLGTRVATLLEAAAGVVGVLVGLLLLVEQAGITVPF
ncbi:high-affinity nickel-transporter protein [Halobium salinum]|uniref:High-affinity nickel-transporter protein n=1 Tax=Halobium salinum TaxID=1364940 RepID=A0ABD5PDQ1_9EURY|nr:high-affinity nickel-transporter protein [Halobium salinum]